MSKTKLIQHDGNQIFKMNFADSENEADVTSIINESINYIETQPKKSVYALTDMTNMFFNTNVSREFTSFLKKNKPYIKKSSVFGVSGLARIVFNSVMKISGRDVKIFKTEEEAVQFLVD
ncbi:MAG: hypothetical protein U9N85_00910 [Bacteroidota bacterium]|nr:hypothetical protein [Bacteroidota bacterium]